MNATQSGMQTKLALVLSLSSIVALGGSLDVYAAPLNLSKVPLYTNASVDPNFVLSTDDSGSMDRAFAPDQLNKPSAQLPPLYPTPINTKCWWQTETFVLSPTGNPIYFNPATVYEPPRRANGTVMDNATWPTGWLDGVTRGNGGATASINLETGYQLDWDIGSTADRPGIIQHSDSPATCDPSVTGAATVQRRFPFGLHAFYYAYTGPALPPEVGPPGETPVEAAARLLQRQTLIFTNSNYTAVRVPDSEKANFANWFAYYRTRNLLTRTALSRVFDSQQNLRMAWQDINSPALANTAPMRTIASSTAAGVTHRNSLFQHVLTLSATGGTPNRAALRRVGDYFSTANTSGSTSESNPYYDLASNRVLSCRQNFHLLVTDGAWKDAAGRTDAPTSDTAARTFPIPQGGTAGVAYPGDAAAQLHNRIYRTETASGGNPGLADNAFYYWATDLRPDLANNVPASYGDLTVGVSGPNTPLGADENPKDRPEVYWNPANDPATWQHLVQYIVAFGVDGTMPNPESVVGFRKNPAATNPATAAPWSWPSWPAEGGESPQKIDDTWHATINSRGEFFSARSPQDLIDALNSVFLSISKRTSSNTPVSLSSGLLTTSTLGYQTLFDTSDWSGRLLATRLGTTPTVPEWDLSCVLTGGTCPSVPALGTLPATGPTQRVIATSGALSGGGIPFQFSSLTTAQRTALGINPDTNVADTLGASRLAYIRGDRSLERSSGGTFRNRKSLLGAIVNSAALVPPQREDYRDWSTDGSTTGSFEATSAERGRKYSEWVDSAPDSPYDTLFVGANDGMLHAVASGPRNPLLPSGTPGGTERWAYVPAAVFKNLNKLTSESALQFQSYVDATPQVRDVFVSGDWKRVLVGGLRLGGQGIYALDVTRPKTITDEASLAAKVMWEFGNDNLGYTYGTPFVTRLASGQWVALIPGGYNSEEADGTVGNGRAYLFVVNVSNGTLIKEFDLGTSSRGLSSVIGGDYRVNGTNPVLSVTDVAFAGDLNGNIWRFNFEGATSGSWTAERFFTAPADQAITVQPRLVRSSYEDAGTIRRKYVVTFGTGKYVENIDRSTTFQQSYYGLYDQGPGSSEYPLNQPKLQRQTMTTVGAVRRLSTTQIPAGKYGWFFDFIAPGERNIAAAVVRNVSGTLIFTTLAPLSTDPCAPAAESYLMFVDATTGGVSGTGAAGLDTNNDGIADSTDLGQLSPAFDSNRDGQINGQDDSLAVGLKLDGYIAGVTPISSVGGGSAQILIPDDETGGGPESIEIANYEWRRRSWRELINQ